MARVTPVHKGGNNLDVNNYRPIYVLPVFSKISEKCIFDKLYKFFFIPKSFIVANLVFFQVDLLLIQ